MANGHVNGQSDIRQYLDDLEAPLRSRPPQRRRGRHLSPSIPVTPKSPGSSFVYAVKGGDRVKFGKADCPLERVRRLQTGSPCELTFVGYAKFSREMVYKVERAVFDIAAGLGIDRKGEWLLINDADASYLLGAAATVCGTVPLGVYGFKADTSYRSPFDLVRDWSTRGAFSARKWR